MVHRDTRSSIVFAGSFNEELISGVDQPVRCVNSVFDAIGELATCGASDLVETVVVDDQLLQEHTTEHLDALRRVDPSAVIVVAGTISASTQADALVPKDTTAAHLASAIINVKYHDSKRTSLIASNL